MRRRGSRLWLGLIIGLILGAVATTGTIAWLHPPADTPPISNTTKSILVTAPIEQQPVRPIYTLSGELTPATTLGIWPLSSSGSASESDKTAVAVSRQVVSKTVLTPGNTVNYGDLVAEVSGAPLFAVPTAVPFYRDLTKDLEGNDVAGLQQMLTDAGLYTGPIDGKLGASTLKALSQMYDRADYKLPETQPGVGLLPLSHLAALPGNQLIVEQVASTGSVLSEEQPLITVRTQAPVIKARVDMIQAPAFTQGTPVHIQVGEATQFDTTIQAVSDFQDAAANTPAGYDVTIAIPAEIDTTPLAGQPVRVTEQSEVPLGTAVPLTAIRRDATGATYVLIPHNSDSATPAAPTSHPVTVVSQTSGYAIITDDPALPVGTNLVVSGA